MGGDVDGRGGFQALQPLTRVVAPPSRIAMALQRINGFCPLICDSMRGQLKLSVIFHLLEK